MKLALKITRQRSTQYANMAATLAMPELLASPIAPMLRAVEPVTMAGQSYLLTDIEKAEAAHLEEKCSSPVDNRLLETLSRLATSGEMYEYFESIGEVPGPFLRPLEPQFTPFVPLEMAETRRYKGKTNELF